MGNLYAALSNSYVGPPCPEGKKLIWNIMCTLLELWVRSARQISQLFLWPAVVKRLPATALSPGGALSLLSTIILLFDFLCWVTSSVKYS